MPALSVAQQDADAAPLASVVVSAGDSWLGIRARMFPVEVLMETNPQLANRALRPGDVVRSPYVHRDELERAQASQTELRGELVSARERIETLERDLAQQRAQLPPLQERLAELESAAVTRERTLTGLAVLTLVIATAIVVLGGISLRLRSKLAERGRKLTATEALYGDLRKGLTDLELEAQRRMLRFLDAHGVRVVSERDVDKAGAPVIELAHKIRERHAG